MLDLESEIINQMNQRIAKSFLDVLILLELRREAMNGYAVIDHVQNKFRITVEPESAYSILNSLENDKFVKGELVQEKRVYRLTEKGEETVKTIQNLRDKILGLVLNILTA